MLEIFNEQSLRKEIAKTWGEHGAHMEVFDSLMKRAYPIIPMSNYQVRVTKRKQAEDLAKIVIKYGEIIWDHSRALDVDPDCNYFMSSDRGWLVRTCDNEKTIIHFNEFVSKFG